MRKVRISFISPSIFAYFFFSEANFACFALLFVRFTLFLRPKNRDEEVSDI